MTIYFILVLCVALSVMALWKPNPVLAVISGASWLGLFTYTRTIPIAGTATGDNFDTIFVIICFGAALILPAYIIFRGKSDRNKAEFEFSGEHPSSRGTRQVASESVREIRSARHGWGGNYAETPEDYQERVHKMLHPKRRR